MNQTVPFSCICVLHIPQFLSRYKNIQHPSYCCCLAFFFWLQHHLLGSVLGAIWFSQFESIFFAVSKSTAYLIGAFPFHSFQSSIFAIHDQYRENQSKMLDMHILPIASETKVVKSQVPYMILTLYTNKGEGFSMGFYFTVLNSYCDFLKQELKFFGGNVRVLMHECISNCNFKCHLTFSGM